MHPSAIGSFFIEDLYVHAKLIFALPYTREILQFCQLFHHFDSDLLFSSEGTQLHQTNDVEENIVGWNKRLLNVVSRSFALTMVALSKQC
jgi:hypothetical protein